ncbi:MAG: biofilm synthesis protein PgaD [Bacteroidetes bacterium]|nr:biofilm synthesis protein PgaD [Bacteroidota bacterium]
MKNFKYKINGNVYEVAIDSIDDTNAKVEVNGVAYDVIIEQSEQQISKPVKRAAQATQASTSSSAQGSAASTVKSPLPGLILDITCSVGESVSKGQQIMSLEAMKMENAINADCDGVIKEIKVTKGETVLEGAVLVLIG